MIRAVEQRNIVVEELTDPQELAKAAARHARFKGNLDWYTENAQEIGEKYRGKCICIAGRELFVSDDPREVLASARAAHPDDDGFFLQYIAKEKGPRIYANQRRMARVR